jgi:hypothetical protein
MADTSAVAPAPVQSFSAADIVNINHTAAMQTTNTTDNISTTDVVSAKRKRIDEDSAPAEAAATSSSEDSQQISAQTQSDILALLVVYASRSFHKY